MVRGLLGFEWRYQTRRMTFVVAAAVFVLLALVLVGTGFGPEGVDVNGPYVVAQSLGLLSLFAVFPVTLFVSQAALRDVEHGMTELVFATPVGRASYVLGRFGGAMLAAGTVLAIAALALSVAPLALAVDADRVGAVRPLTYVWPLLIIVVPNLVFVGAVIFAAAALTRSTRATYVAGVAVYAVYFVTALLIDSPLMAGAAPPTPEALARAALLDPFGLSAFFEQTRYWTAAERDVRPLALAGRLLLNRVLWLGVAAATLALTYRRLTMGVMPGPSAPPVPPSEEPPPAVRRPPLLPDAGGARAFAATLLHGAREEVRHLVRGWPFLALLLLWAFVAGMEAIGALSGGEYGTRVVPRTGLLLNAMRLPLVLLGIVTLVYFTAETAWRERASGMAPLVDATPAPTAALYLAKAIALGAVPLVMVLVAAGVGMLLQIAHGGWSPEPGLFLALIWFGGMPLLLFALGALAIQALSPNRWVGMFGAIALAVLGQRGDLVGLEHPMLRYGDAPSPVHSDIGGFGAAGASFTAFMAYWAVAAALITCVGWGAWPRGLDAPAHARLATLRRRWGPRGTRVTLAALALFAVAAGALFWATSIARPWEGREAQSAWRADYERAYRRLARLPQPSVVAVRTAVDFLPAERAARLRGVYRLENRTAFAIDTVWVTVPRDASEEDVRMAGTGPALVDRRFGVHALPLSRPLGPGATAELEFAWTLDGSGVRAGGIDEDLAVNGSVITSNAYPTIGYRVTYELSDPSARRAQKLTGESLGLAPLPPADSLRMVAEARRPQAWLTLDATLSTSLDQTALGPGRLAGAWEADGRRFFRYVVDRPMTPRFGFVSARHAVRRVQHGAVTVEIWHHATHGGNVERMLAAATRSLDQLEPRYGAYARSHLRIVEVPTWSRFAALALTGFIPFTEDRGFLADPRAEDVDLVTRRIAHEVAHQWWGHTLDPADVAGATFLVESLAKDAEQLVIADLHGASALPPLLRFDEDRYLAGRADASGPEPALAEVTGQPYVFYGKGAVVMGALRDLLGSPAVDRAQAGLLATHGGPGGTATSLDLVERLAAGARTPMERRLVREWLTDRIVYDLAVDSAVANAGPGGSYRLRAWVRAGSTLRRPDGAEEPRAVEGEPVEIAVFDGAGGTGRILYRGRHPIESGRVTVALDLQARPATVAVDPFVRRIDRDRFDNARSVQVR